MFERNELLPISYITSKDQTLSFLELDIFIMEKGHVGLALAKITSHKAWVDNVVLKLDHNAPCSLFQESSTAIDNDL